uniref:protein-serine/threonine phosphatase n=2 Tax=Zea mays TaxID=4577 RepID=A0A804QUV4_MAIZE
MNSSEASTQDRVAPALEATEKILAAVARLPGRRMLELRRLGRAAPSAGAETEAAKRGRSVSDDTSAGSSRESSAKVAPEPEPQGGGAPAVAPGWPRPVSHGAMSVIGRRREMEDAVAVAAPFPAGVEFFAVYDGHGGSRVADACRERLHVVLAEEVAARLHLVRNGGEDEEGDGARWREAMEACFARVDGEVAVVESESNNVGHAVTVGSTAVVVVVGPRHIVVANCGDSRAVLSRGGVPVPLSSDHKAKRGQAGLHLAGAKANGSPRPRRACSVAVTQLARCKGCLVGSRSASSDSVIRCASIHAA